MKKADLLIKNASIWHAQDQTISKTDNSIVIHKGKILEIGKLQDLAAQYWVTKTWKQLTQRIKKKPPTPSADK